jgi:hypothetical protein
VPATVLAFWQFAFCKFNEALPGMMFAVQTDTRYARTHKKKPNRNHDKWNDTIVNDNDNNANTKDLLANA